MNKIVLAVCVLALAVSSVNTVLLVGMITALQEKGAKIEAVAKEIDKFRPMVQALSEQVKALPDKPPPKLPIDPKEKTIETPEPVLPPKKPLDPVPLPLPKR